jgi:hypothetical protein
MSLLTHRRAGLLAVASISLAFASPVHAQSDDKAVMTVVTRFFDGMRTRDTSLMRSTVLPSAVLERAGTGPTGLAEPMAIGQFIDRVGHGTGPGGDEKIRNPTVLIDGALASVWTYYTYTPGGQTTASHCGTDSILLRKGPDGWKIFHLADTSRSEGCTPIK